MSDRSRRILNEALELTPEERADLIAHLAETLDAAAADIEPDPEFAAIVARRVAELRTGTARTIPWEDARQQLWKQLEDAVARRAS